ncbi:multidrug resistance protein fnx1 [Diplogelasinospora grovesii]|uniref:Multidrug resistance protein fnx1 n=1 Tax=Diplogelasinospora grovesii TaxID=303347 RepID=A0AAN6MYS0_9PEZI|nr:multidrug resistance protein fnx1 [Diplogelasinospora grovesii]
MIPSGETEKGVLPSRTLGGESSGLSSPETSSLQQLPREPIVLNEQTNYVPTKRIISIFLACATIDFAALIDQTSLAASLTIVGSALSAGSERAWIAGSYFVTSTAFQLLYGRLSDVWSRKVILLVGLAIFFFGSLAASLAQTATQLIVFRAFTGVGGGGLMTVAQMIVSDVVPLRERGKWQGILGAFVAIANGVGPVIGGALATSSTDGWRWIFRLNLPLTVISVLCVIFIMPLKKVHGSWKVKLKAIDFFGTFIALAGSTVLMLGLTWAGSSYAWNSAHVVATLVVGLALMVAFVVWQGIGTSVPLVPLRIFKSGIVNGASLTMFINGWNFVMQVYYVPTFYQLVYGYSATRSGALLLPITVTQTFSSTLSGLIVTWRGRYRESILFGWALWAIGLGLFSTLDRNSSVGAQIGYALLTGFGVGQTLQPSLIAIQAGVDRKDMAIVTGFRNFIRNMGSTLGLCISSTIINNVLRSNLNNLGLSETIIRQILDEPESVSELALPEGTGELVAAVTAGYQTGFRIVFYVGAGLSTLGFVISWFLMPQIDLDRPDDAKLKEEGRRAEEERKNKLRGIEAGGIGKEEQGKK